MTRTAAAAAMAALTLAAGAAHGEEPADHFQTVIGGRYRIIAIEQPQRDLAGGSPLLNVLFDAETGRSWVLRYDVDPVTRRDGYVWVEVPMVGSAR